MMENFGLTEKPMPHEEASRRWKRRAGLTGFVHHDRHHARRHARDDGEILVRVETQRLEHHAVLDQRARDRMEEGVAVGRRADDQGGADVAVCAYYCGDTEQARCKSVTTGRDCFGPAQVRDISTSQAKPLLSSRDRQHQVFVRRAGKHDIGLSWIGNIRAPRITRHFPNQGADDHHMRPGLHPMLMG